MLSDDVLVLQDTSYNGIQNFDFRTGYVRFMKDVNRLQPKDSGAEEVDSDGNPFIRFYGKHEREEWEAKFHKKVFPVLFNQCECP